MQSTAAMPTSARAQPSTPVPPAREVRSAPAAAVVPGLFVLIWASGFVVARLTIPHADPLAFTTLRFSTVALVLCLLGLCLRVRWPAGPAGWLGPLVAGALMQGVYLSGVFWAVSRGLPAGIAALVGSLQPLMTAVLARPLLGERVSRQRALGIAVGFLGAGLVLAPKVGATDPSGIPPTALVACFLAVLALTLGTLWQKRARGGGDLLADAAVQFIGGAACALPLALAFGHWRIEPVASLWFGFGWSVLVNSVAGIMLLLALLRRGAVAGVAALFFLVPPVTAGLGYLMFDETLTLLQCAGMAVAALGVAVASRG